MPRSPGIVVRTVGGGRADGGRNCGFWTYQQCQQAVWGTGGFCQVNAMYRGPQPGMIVRRRPAIADGSASGATHPPHARIDPAGEAHMQNIFPVLIYRARRSWPAANRAAPRSPILGAFEFGGGNDGGGRNCGFWTYQQCQQTVFGTGGYCEVNAMYRGPQPGMIPPPPGYRGR